MFKLDTDLTDTDLTDTDFELRSAQNGDAVVISVTGEIDMATAPELAQAIHAAPDQVERVVVDLSTVSFLDSSGLNALVTGQRGLAKRRIGFRIVSPADQAVRRVFEITQLESSLSVVESLADALA